MAHVVIQVGNDYIESVIPEMGSGAICLLGKPETTRGSTWRWRRSALDSDYLLRYCPERYRLGASRGLVSC